jgi:hypothetical protein
MASLARSLTAEQKMQKATTTTRAGDGPPVDCAAGGGGVKSRERPSRDVKGRPTGRISVKTEKANRRFEWWCLRWRPFLHFFNFGAMPYIPAKAHLS